jgi:hypothetical protein
MSRPRRRLSVDCCEIETEPAPPRERHRHGRLHVRRQRAHAIARATRVVSAWGTLEPGTMTMARAIRKHTSDRAPWRSTPKGKALRDRRQRDRERADAADAEEATTWSAR